MPIRRKPRKSPIDDFVSMIVPDRIEEAFDRVENYFTEHLKLSFDSPEGVAGVLNELIRDHGPKVRRVLYALLCEENGALRPIVSGATASGAKSAVGFLVPVIAAQFALAPAVALLIATLVIKAVAASGEKSLCEEMILQQKKAARHTRGTETQLRVNQQRRNAAPRRKTNDAQPGPRPARTKRRTTEEAATEKPRTTKRPKIEGDTPLRRASRKTPPKAEGS